MGGSPPQVRGKLDIDEATGGRIGITPAGAGKTENPSGNPLWAGDHPRRCGENSNRASPVLSTQGSPPQVRGKRLVCTPYAQRHRITPAGAGKTSKWGSGRPLNQDHPRRCGENEFKQATYQTKTGSPPQVRGKPDEVTAYQAEARITPAGAGKTGMAAFANFWQKDHPRRCGENIYLPPCGSDSKGSPPQVRGKPARSITARDVHQDHPRRCGENTA